MYKITNDNLIKSMWNDWKWYKWGIVLYTPGDNNWAEKCPGKCYILFQIYFLTIETL